MGTVITSVNRKMRGNALSKRKSIILLGSYPPPFGGIPTFNQTLFSHLKPWGALIWARSSQSLQDPQATPLDSNPVRMVQNLIRDAKKAIILDSSFFFLEAPNKILILIFLFLKPFLKFRFIKILHSGRTQSLHSKFSFIKKIFFRCSLFLIDEYITVNRNLYDWLADDIKVKRDITIIPSLLPLPEKIFSENLDPGIQKELSRYSHLIISIGLFVPNYGFREISDAVEILRNKTQKNIGLLLVEGKVGDNPDYREQILNNRDWINVITDIPQSQVIPLLKASDLFMRATTEDSYGLSKIESLWCGTPVLSTGQGETRGMNIIDKSNLNQIVQTMETVLNNPDPERLDRYSKIFKEEAQQNLKSYLHLLGIVYE